MDAVAEDLVDWGKGERKEMTTPFGVDLMRSQVLHRAAQVGKGTLRVDFDLIT